MTRTQSTTFLTMLSWLFSLCGCGDPDPPSDGLDPNPSILREITVSGFDSDGEPVIREMSDGSLWVHFESMPPFFTDDDPDSFDLEEFRSKMQAAVGTSVIQDDREVFVIANPKGDTVDSLKTWLETYRNENGG